MENNVVTFGCSYVIVLICFNGTYPFFDPESRCDLRVACAQGLCTCFQWRSVPPGRGSATEARQIQSGKTHHVWHHVSNHVSHGFTTDYLIVLCVCVRETNEGCTPRLQDHASC